MFFNCLSVEGVVDDCANRSDVCFVLTRGQAFG